MTSFKCPPRLLTVARIRVVQFSMTFPHRSTASGSAVHFDGPPRCSRLILCFLNVQVWVDRLTNRLFQIWPPNAEESTVKGHHVYRKMGAMHATFALTLILIIKFYHLYALFNRVTCHGDLA